MSKANSVVPELAQTLLTEANFLHCQESQCMNHALTGHASSHQGLLIGGAVDVDESFTQVASGSVEVETCMN